MHVQVQVKGLARSAELRRFALLKLSAVLSRFSHVIQDVVMRLSDINGPNRGGVDKLCRVVLTMKNGSGLVVEDLAADITRAIDRVTDRLDQFVSRRWSGA